MAFRPLVLLLLCGGFACSTANPLYCDEATDCTGTRDYCDLDGFYHPAGLANTCIETPTNETCNDVEQGQCDADQRCRAATSPGEAGVCVECLGSVDCGGAECGPDNRCKPASCEGVDTGDATCVDFDSSRPYCSEEMVCVECVTSRQCADQDQPACDSTSLECRACIANSECASGACDFGNDKCIRPEKIVYVDGMTGLDDGECQTSDKPCLTIEFALDKVEPERNIMVVEAGSYSEQLVITKNVSVIGRGDVIINPTLQNGANAAVTIEGDAIVGFSNIDVILPAGGDSDGIGIYCVDDGGTQPQLSFELGRVSGSPGRGIVSEKCNLRLTRSMIDDNAGGGIEVSEAPFSIVNNYIVENGTYGTGGSAFGGLYFDTTMSLAEVLEFNTIVANLQVSLTEANAVRCNATTLTARNNILMNLVADTRILADDSCDHAFSIFDGDSNDVLPGTNNIKIDATFAPSGGLAYRLDPSSAGAGGASQNSSVVIDFDGEPRPQGAGPNSDIGADEVAEP